MPILFVIFYSVALALALGYLALIYRLVAIWHSLPGFVVDESSSPKVFLSIVIPARNEAETIGACLEAIARQDYPANQYEVLVVDDHSTDATAEIARQCLLPNFKLLPLADYPELDARAGFKKQAITWAIAHARGELIVTTDADCLAPSDWLRSLAACYERDSARFIAAPVVFTPTQSLLEDFQALDFLGMMLLTGAGIYTGWFYLSNGANLAYPKEVFSEVSGFRGIQDIASGDDMLLLHKIVEQNPKGIRFLKSARAAVHTTAQPNLQAFIQQRLRWAAKSNRFGDQRLIAVQALVFFLCWSILLSAPAALCWGWPALLTGLILLLIKAMADHKLLSTAVHFFGYVPLLNRFWPAQILHILYIAGIGLLANIRKQYEWKGRRVR